VVLHRRGRPLALQPFGLAAAEMRACTHAHAVKSAVAAARGSPSRRERMSHTRHLGRP
jgi:hypothetical protein